MEEIGKVDKMVRKAALIIAVSWILLVAFIVVSANADNTKVHPPTSKHMVLLVHMEANDPMWENPHQPSKEFSKTTYDLMSGMPLGKEVLRTDKHLHCKGQPVLHNQQDLL
ncbi:hypothetical protein CR513_52989, partial [Mucuna pruriens]